MSLSAAAAGSAIGGGSMVHRLTSTGGFIDWRRRRTAAVPGTRAYGKYDALYELTFYLLTYLHSLRCVQQGRYCEISATEHYYTLRLFIWRISTFMMTSKQCGRVTSKLVMLDALASPAMRHWGTCLLDFHLIFWSLHSRTNSWVSFIGLYVVACQDKTRSSAIAVKADRTACRSTIGWNNYCVIRYLF